MNNEMTIGLSETENYPIRISMRDKSFTLSIDVSVPYAAFLRDQLDLVLRHCDNKPPRCNAEMNFRGNYSHDPDIPCPIHGSFTTGGTT